MARDAVIVALFPGKCFPSQGIRLSEPILGWAAATAGGSSGTFIYPSWAQFTLRFIPYMSQQCMNLLVGAI
jgi:hypothetical protein